MQTHCPNCHARTRLSDDHARVRVRCSECGRVFVARALGHGAAPRRRSLALLLGGLAGVLALVVLFVFLRTKGEIGTAREPASASSSAD